MECNIPDAIKEVETVEVRHVSTRWQGQHASRLELVRPHGAIQLYSNGNEEVCGTSLAGVITVDSNGHSDKLQNRV